MGRQTLPLIIALLTCSLAAPADGPLHRSYTGRPLIEALEDLRSQGLALIYSSDLVRQDMRVLAEPVAATLRGTLEDLIAPHGLETRDGPGGTILIVASDPGAGPTGGIAGRVTGGDGAPAPGALVSVPGTSISVLTESDGRFLIPRLQPGSWPLDVRSADGRTQQTVEVPVTAGDVTRVTIELSPAPHVIEAIVVTPTQYRINGDTPETRSSVQGEELSRLAHLGDDVHRAAARLPGAASGDKSARFSMRGGESNEVLVVLDGLEIDQPFHLKEFLAFSGIVDSQAIERVDLLTGGFPVEYGGRMSGVMELSSSTPAERTSTSLGTGLPNSRLLTEGRARADAVRWLFAARAWYPDAVLDLVDPGGEDINPYYYDLLGKVEFRLDGGTRISGHILAARDQVDFSGEDFEDSARARYDTTYAWLNLGTPWTPRLFSTTQVSAGRVDSSRHGQIEDPMEGNTHIDDQRVSSFFGARQDWIFRGSERYLFKWGFDARTLDAEYDYTSHTEITDPIFTAPGSPSIVDRRIVTRPTGSRLAAYAAMRAKLLPSLTAEVGFRWDRQTYSGDTQADPRVNLVWATGERSTVRAAWGLFHQSQRIDELQVEDGVSDFSPAQRSEHRLISFEHDTDAGFSFRVDAYWKVISSLRPRFENLFNPLALLPEGESDRVRIAPRRATTKGAELFLRGDPTEEISWWAGYALASAEDDIDGRTEPRSWDQRHAVNLGLGYRFRPGWEIDLAGVWHSGWPTTRVEARAATDPNGMVTILPTLGPRNDERFPSYHRLDLRFTRRFHLPESTLTLFLEVLNLYDRSNVCCVDDFGFHPEAGGSVRVERHDGYWLERVPSLGISWKF